MNKLLFLFLGVSLSCFGFEKLDSKYLVRYGNPDAKTQVVEYFSLSCPQCLKLFQKDFPSIRERHIDTGAVSWVFHPDPADILTLQAMVCLGLLSESAKPIFLEKLMKHLESSRNIDFLMPNLGNLEFLEKSEAFQDALAFVTQEDVITILPAVEINGVIYEEFPDASFIEEKLL